MRPLRLVLLLAVLLVGCDDDPLQPVPLAPGETAPLLARLRFDPEAPRLVSAHRGGPEPGYPENCLATFEHVLEYGDVFIECDVRRTADGVLVLMHDDELERTTDGQGRVSTSNAADLERLRLRDEAGTLTEHPVPTVDGALEWARGKATLMLDIKEGVPPADVVAAIRRSGAEDRVVVILYTTPDLRRYLEVAPDLAYSVSTRNPRDVQAVLATGADPTRLIAFIGVGRFDPRVPVLLHEHGIRAILGTFGEIDDRARREGGEAFESLLDGGIDVLATDAVLPAVEAVRDFGLAPARR